MDRQKGGETKHGGGGVPYLAIMQLPLIQLLGAPHPSLSPECHKGKVSPSAPSLPPQATPLDLMQAKALPLPTAPWTTTPEVLGKSGIRLSCSSKLPIQAVLPHALVVK